MLKRIHESNYYRKKVCATKLFNSNLFIEEALRSLPDTWFSVAECAPLKCNVRWCVQSFLYHSISPSVSKPSHVINFIRMSPQGNGFPAVALKMSIWVWIILVCNSKNTGMDFRKIFLENENSKYARFWCEIGLGFGDHSGTYTARKAKIPRSTRPRAVETSWLGKNNLRFHSLCRPHLSFFRAWNFRFVCFQSSVYVIAEGLVELNLTVRRERRLQTTRCVCTRNVARN